jgi:multiple sugar transport system permease protein
MQVPNVAIKQKKHYSKLNRSKTITGFLFALPWIIGFLVFSLYPICISIYYSMTDFNIFKSPKWVGFANYTGLFADEKFYKSLWNTFYMVVVGTPVSIVAALLLAVLLNQKIKGLPFFRTIFYLPSIVPTVAASLLWLWILNPQYGVMNAILKLFGLPQPNWLMDPKFTKPALIIMGLWGIGNMMIIFLASLQDVPGSLYEAAEMDGANAVQRFFYITLPGISPVIFFEIIMNVIYYFQFFTQAYLMINGSTGGSGLNGVSGGAENSLLFYSLYLFHNAFGYFKMGKASAMAWILFIIVMIVTALIFKTQDRWVSYGDE